MDSLSALLAVLLATIGVLVIIGIALIISLATYIISALALHKISKKAGCTLGWLAWIPISFCQTFVLLDIAHDKPFSLFGGKIRFNNRSTSFIVFVIVTLVFGAISGCISGFSSSISVFMENVSGELAMSIAVITIVLSIISCIISLLFSVFSVCFNYVYIRDAIEVFNPFGVSNKRTAVLVAIFSAFCPLVLSIYLLVLSKKDIPYHAA